MKDIELTHLVDAKLVTLTAVRSTAAEQYRALRTNLEFLTVSGAISSIQVTSGVPGAGKTLTAANLAIALAQAGKTTLLVDADLRRPSIHRVFGNGNLTGLTTAITRSDEWDKFVVPGPIQSLSLMTSGPIPPNPSELLSSAAMRHLLADMRRDFEIVVLDTPPVVAYTDAVALAQHVDGTIYVVRAGHASRKADLKGQERLKQVDARVLGVVLNSVGMEDDVYSYYYGYGEDK